jgi:hypothetical protein
MQKVGKKYSLSNIEEKSIKQTDNKNIYKLDGVVSVATEKEVDISKELSATDAADGVKYVADSSIDISTGRPSETLSQSAAANEPASTNTNNAGTNATVPDGNNPETANPGIDAGKTVTVQKTEVGSLNVRKDPNAKASIIAKIYPGDVYKVLSEKTGWFQLELNDGKTGWASSRYLK